MVTWMVGVTTIPSRRGTLLPRTLQSLKSGGFDRPHLFVDGDYDSASWVREFGLNTTARYPNVRTVVDHGGGRKVIRPDVCGNWVLSLYELYYRNPDADRYVIFQDDCVCYPHLKEYLDSCPFPDKGYWNLYTFYSNQVRAKGDGWFVSNQLGRGAVGLVFDREGVVTLLCSRFMAERPQDKVRGHKGIDGGIVTALRKAGYQEYVHSPSLLQHTGKESSAGNNPHQPSPSFRGEDFDPNVLLVK